MTATFLGPETFPAPYALTPSPIRRLLSVAQQSSVVQLCLGAPEPAWFPTEGLARAAEQVLRTGACLGYGTSEGLPDLRAWIAERLRRRGIVATPERILMTNGSQHGLQVAMRLLAGPASAIALEEPTYPGARQAAELTGAAIHALRLADGRLPDLERLASLRRTDKVRVLWTMPTARNPTGATLTLGERERLAEACARLGVALIEDDPYHELWYGEEPACSLAALHAATIVCGSFSKILVPGLRLGWLCVPAELAAPAAVAIQATCLAANHVAQHIAWAWLRSEGLDAHLVRLRQGYRLRRDALLACLRTDCPQLRPGPSAEGGFFQWVGLPEGISGQALAERGLVHGVAVLPGGAFHGPDGIDDRLRLSFSQFGSEGAAGVQRLAVALADLGRREW